MTEVIVLEDWVASATDWIRERLEAARSERGRATLALSGGGTPQPVYASLATGLDWTGIELYYGDERCVPPDSPDSTHGMVVRTLLDHVPGAPPTVQRMEGEDRDFDAAAARYEALLPDRLDVALQGIGPDGHTASLFPGHPAVNEHERRVVHVAGSPKPPPDRLTLTPPALRAARHIVVLARGADKAEAVARALSGPLDVGACPAQLCRSGAWFLDLAAASALKREESA